MRGVLRLAGGLLLASVVTGCGGRMASVQGKVTFAEDGAPLTRGMVVFERLDGDRATAARGEIGPDGNYRLSTSRPEDGVPPGKYRVLVSVPEPRGAAAAAIGPVPAVDPKFMEFSTSGLEFEVRAGTNEIPIRVTRPRGHTG